MVDERNLCVVPGCSNPRRSAAPQAKYCEECARERKRQNSLESRTYEERKEQQRAYQREYRKKHPGLSTPYVRRFRAKRAAFPPVAGVAAVRVPLTLSAFMAAETAPA
jgi:hypothetical protein